ncbi:MAG: SUMF1/EgtB/PvdO family nonheme iron enzyme [Nanoarchaeota archaeon]
MNNRMNNSFTYVMILILCIGSFPVAAGQVQKGTLGAKVAESYDCTGKRFGLVGASNTVDTNPDGSSIPLSWRNVKIIQDLCPGATVFLNARGGTWPGAQMSLVQAVLQNDDLGYVILDPSANGQQDSSGITPEKYKEAAIALAKLVKDKNKNIKVIMLTNTPTKGNPTDYGSPNTIQRIKAFNTDLLQNKLGRSDLIDYAVNTYSATENPPGSDSCGSYCGTDHIHFAEEGRKRVMKAVMDKVFGSPTTVSVVTNTPVSPTSSTAAENCLNPQRCKEIDEVWLFIVKWINSARINQIFNTVTGKFEVKAAPTVVITPGVPSAKVGEAAVANKLYKDILTNLPNQNLAKAMVANAKGESGLNSKTAGDCGEYAERNAGSSIPISGKGRCCSFGLWQYNICGGLGTTFLQSYGSPSSDQAKLAVVHDYQKNIDFMVSYLKKTYSDEIQQQKPIDEWVAWFVREIERPANQASEIAKRQGFARELESNGAFGDTIPQSSPSPPTSGAIFSSCPSEMSTIDNNYCIDKWENIIIDKAAGQQASYNWVPDLKLVGGQKSLKANPEQPPFPDAFGPQFSTSFAPLAVSKFGVYPQTYMNRKIAEVACQNAGKRLCTRVEWYNACVGPTGQKVATGATTFPEVMPYGTTRNPGVCNDNKQSLHPPNLLGQSPIYPQDPRFAQIAQQRGAVVKTGELSQCTNEYGVYDMAGNVDEIVSDVPIENPSNMMFVGGYYARDQTGINGIHCGSVITAHDANSYYDYSIGFRCCATLS